MSKKIFLVFGILLLFFTIHLISGESLDFAPLNPEFLKSSTGNSIVITTPAPLSLPSALYSSAPSSFDLRSYKKVSPVKNQGTAGSCWAFATYASLESYLLSNNETLDFSENHMKNILSSSYQDGFDRKASDGGNHFISTAYLVRWSGPIPEFIDPYDANSTSSSESLQPVKHVQEVVFIPDRKSPSDNNAIKQAIMKYGAIYTTMYYNKAYLAKEKNYYYSGPAMSNHAVSIVGWIDDYSRTNFYGSASGIPAGNGAFIVKNSWGSLWGESGYFYISYYDSNIGKNCVVFNNAEPIDNYNQIYQYDPLGWVTSVGFDDDTAHFANVYTATQTGLLQAVGFYTPVLNSQYEVRIYKNVSYNSPIDGTIAVVKTGIISDPGYHTVRFPADVPVSKNERFSAFVRLKTPGYNYPIPVEIPVSGYSSKATASPEQSYVSKDGIYWSDITSSIPGANVCIKVYGSSLEIELVSPNGGEKLEQGSTTTIMWKYAGNTKGNVKLELMKNDKLYFVIASGINIGSSGNGSYCWKIPTNIQDSNDYKIRISSLTNSSVMDCSDSTFSITAGKIVVESPSSNAVFSKNTNQLIQWKSYGNVGSFIKVELLKSGQFKGTIISKTSTNVTGSCVWKIPANIEAGDDYQIKVVSTTKPEIYGLSQPFSINGPSIKLTSPGNGEIWYTNTIQKIAWTYSGIYPVWLKIECLSGNSSNLIAHVYTNKSSDLYQWYVSSTLPASNNYKIRITAVEDSSITDVSDGYFTISNGSITLVSPSGNEKWVTGETKNIVWTYKGNPGNMVKLELYRDSNYVGIIGSKSIGSGNTGSFVWKIPKEIKPGSGYRIRIVSTTNPNISVTGNCFSIVTSIDESNFGVIRSIYDEMQDYSH